MGVFVEVTEIKKSTDLAVLFYQLFFLKKILIF